MICFIFKVCLGEDALQLKAGQVVDNGGNLRVVNGTDVMFFTFNDYRGMIIAIFVTLSDIV